MTKEQALNQFWNSFNIPAYNENTVPDDIEFPYITYSTNMSFFNEPILLSASIWYNEMTWENISRKAAEISEYIGLGGISQPYDGGRIWIKRGTPFSQTMGEPGSKLTRRIYLNIEAEFQSIN